jgi:hypothetical protein
VRLRLLASLYSKSFTGEGENSLVSSAGRVRKPVMMGQMVFTMAGKAGTMHR